MVTPGPRQGQAPGDRPVVSISSITLIGATISWDNVDRADEYDLEVDNDSDFLSPEETRRTTSLSQTITNLSANTLYYVQVRARNNLGTGPWSIVQTFTTLAEPLSPLTIPPDFRVTSLAYNSVTFDWDPVSGEFLLYHVQVSRNSAYTDLLYNSRVSTDEATVTGLTGNTQYWARVRAEDIDGMSGWNSISFTTPEESNPPTTAPSGLSITQILNSSARASWNLVSLAARYGIQVDDTSNFSSPLIDTATTSLTYQLSGLSGSTPYYVRVRAENDDGVGPWSNSQVFTTQPDPTAPTSAPGGLDVDNIDTDSADVSWNSVPDTDFYRLDVSENSSFTQIVDEYTTTELSERLSGLDDNTRYWLRVRAENDIGAGPWSNSVSFRTDQTPPTPRSISFTFQATPAAPPDPSSVTFTFQATPAAPRPTSFTFQAVPAESRNVTFDFVAIQARSPRDVTFDFKGRRIIEPRSVSFSYEFQQVSPRPASFTFQSESEEEIPPVQMPGTGFDIVVLDSNTNNAYRVNPSNPGSRTGGYGSLGRPSGIDEDDFPRAIATIGNTLYWFLDTDFIHSLNISTGASTNHGRFGLTGIIAGADYIGNNVFILAVDDYPSHSIRTLNLSTRTVARLGTTPDEPNRDEPILLGSISRDPVSGDYFGTAPFTGGFYRINPADTDSSAGVYGYVGDFGGADFPHAMDFIDGVPYIAGIDRSLLRVNLSNASAINRRTIYSGPRPFGMTSIPKLPINRLGTPIIQVVDVQTRSALLLITRSAQATSYRVRVIRTSGNVQVRSISTTNVTVLLDELDLDTEYRVEVQALTTDTDIDDSRTATETFRTQTVRAVSFDFNVPVPPIDIPVISIIRIGFQSITFTSEHQRGSFQNEEYFWILTLGNLRTQGTFAPYEIVHLDSLDQETEYRLLVYGIRGGVLGLPDVEFFTTRSPESVEWGYFAIMAVPRPFIFNFYVVPGLPEVPRNVQVDFITVPQLPSHVLYDFQATPRIARPIEFNFYASPVVPRSTFFEFSSVEPFPREVNLDFQAEPFNPEEVLFIFHAVLPTPRPVEVDFLAVAPRTVRLDFQTVLPNPRFVFFTFSAYSDILLPAPSINNLVPRMIEELAVPVIESDTKAHIHLGAGNDLAAEILGPLRRIWMINNDGRFGLSGPYFDARSAHEMGTVFRFYPNPNTNNRTPLGVGTIGLVDILNLIVGTTAYTFTRGLGAYIRSVAKNVLLYFELEFAPTTIYIRYYDRDRFRIRAEGEAAEGDSIEFLVGINIQQVPIDLPVDPARSQLSRIEWQASAHVAWPDLIYYIGPWNNEAGRALPGPILHPHGESEMRIENSRDSAISLSPPSIPTMNAIIFDENDFLTRYLHTDRWPLHLTYAKATVIFESNGYYEASFSGVLNTPNYVNDDTHKWLHISATGMSSLLTQNARLNHPRLFTPADDMTIGKIIVESTRHYAQVNNLDLEDILADDPQTVEDDFPMPVAYWWMSGENLWTVYQRCIASQGPPATFYENALGKVVFWSGRRPREAPVEIGSQPGTVSFAPIIEGAIMVTDHIGDIVNDAAIPVQAKGFVTPSNLVYSTDDNPRPHVPEWYNYSKRLEEVDSNLAGHTHMLGGGAVAPTSILPLATPLPVPKPENVIRQSEEERYNYENEPTNPPVSPTVGPTNRGELPSYTDEEILRGDNIEPVVLWTNTPEYALHALGGAQRTIPAGESLRYLYSHSEPFLREEILVNTDGYGVTFQEPLTPAVQYITTVLRLSATDVEIIVTHTAGIAVPIPRLVLVGVALRSLGVVNYLTSHLVRNDARTVVSRDRYRYRNFDYAGYTSIYPRQADLLADWVVEFYRDGIKTMRLSAYVQGVGERFLQAMRLRPLQPVVVYHPRLLQPAWAVQHAGPVGHSPAGGAAPPHHVRAR